MSLKYFSEPISQRGIDNTLPFWFFQDITAIITKGSVLEPDFHSFDLCFARMEQTYHNSKKDVKDLKQRLELKDNEGVLYLRFGAHIFGFLNSVEKRIDADTECNVPKIIDMFTKESGFKDLIHMAKRKIVTYGVLANEYNGGSLIHMNGIGFIINHKGNLTENDLNVPMTNLFHKYGDYSGGFIGDDKLKGLEFLMNYKRLVDLHQMYKSTELSITR